MLRYPARFSDDVPRQKRDSEPIRGSEHQASQNCALALTVALACSRRDAVTLVELLQEERLTPKWFVVYFEDFAYEFHA
jgi:hypothetical protein